jgi:hypothetical protein
MPALPLRVSHFVSSECKLTECKLRRPRRRPVAGGWPACSHAAAGAAAAVAVAISYLITGGPARGSWALGSWAEVSTRVWG